MARPGSSSKFVSVNLNKSYGQPHSLSAAAAGGGGGGSGPGSSSFSSAPGLYRSRSTNSHGGMVLLSRPSRPQPPSSPSISSASFKGSKLAVPRPVNLPSLRREHAGNDPTVALVGGSGSSGWSKQQVSALPVDDAVGQPGVSLVDSAVGEVRSAALPVESSWGAPVSQGRGVAALDGVNRNEAGRSPISQAPAGRPAVYTPPGARNARTNGSPDLVPLAVQKAVVLRGEDFPSLQAAAPSPAVPPQLRQKDLQQKQREKQHDLKEQQKKLHQLSQQQQHAQKTGEDASLAQHHAGPQLQPAHPVRSPLKKHASSLSKDEVRSLDHHDTVVEQSHGRSGKASQGPSPLIRWNHTSNWADDERETLQTFPRGMAQSNRVEQGRPRNGYRLAEDLAFDHSADVGFGRPVSRNGSLSGLGRDRDDFQDKFPVRNGGLGFEGGHSKDGDFSNGFIKDIHSDRPVLELRDDTGKWDGGFGRNDSFKGGWGSAVKDSNSNRDARFGNSRRLASFNRDNLVNRDNGFERDINGRIFRDAGDGRDATYRGDALGRDTTSRNAYSRDERLGQDSGLGVDAFLNKRGAVRVNLDRGRGWQGGDSTGRSNGNGNAYRFDGPAASSHTSSHVSARGRRDLNASDYGRDKRPKVSYGQANVEDPFLGDIMDHRRNPVFGLEALGSAFGLEVKALKRKKEGPKDTDFRDLARESFEAELERVQKMQEQDRQRIIEEREKAIELARKEQEERERRAREEEELRLRLEEEAKEAAARAQRVVEEAARKVEEERMAREEEKKRMLGEEDRRKEAARRKLLELEERIAKRTREEGLQKEARAFPVRSVNDEEGSRFQDSRRSKDMNWEDQERFLPGFGKTIQDNDEQADRPLLSLAGREFVEGPSSQARLLDTGLQSADIKVERNKTEQMWRRETLDNGHALPVALMKSPSREDLFPHRQREQQQGGLSFRELKHGTRRNSLSVYSQERGQSEFSARSNRPSSVQEQRWTSNDETGVSVRYSTADVDTGYVDITNESDADRWWGRDNRRRIREGQQPLSSYLHGEESADYPSFGRLRQSLPKQPRVPPPLPGRATIHRQTFKLEDIRSVPTTLADDASGIALKANDMFSSRADPEANEPEDDNTADELLIDEELLKLQESALEETSLQPDIKLEESDELIKDVLTYKSQTFDEDLHEEVVSETPSEIDNGISSPTACADKPGDFEMEIAIDLQAVKEQEQKDGNSNCDVQAQENDLVKEVGCGDCVQVQNEGIYEDQETGSLKVIKEEVDNGEHVNEYLPAEYEGVNVEEQRHEDAHKEDLTEDDDKLINPQLQDPNEISHKVGEEAELDLEDAVSQKAVQEPVVPPVPQMSESAMESVQMRQSEGSSPRQSLLQQLQQPFSFMAVPLPQSPPNTVTPHQPMLASMHGLQNQQEVPFHLQMGLLPGTPFMPNAIQIGSIQMPLHLHPQMPQLAHMQSQQPPFFQFGQIGHSAPLSPSLPLMQPAMHMHHEMVQPLVPQHHQLQAGALSQAEASNKYPNTVAFSKAGDDLQVQTASPRWMDHNASLEGSGHSEHTPSRSHLGSECNFEREDQVPLVDRLEIISDEPVLPLMEQSSARALPIVSTGHETVTEVVSPIDAVAVEKTKVEQRSSALPSGIIPGGRRKSNPVRSYGVLGRGRGRFYGRKNGFEAPHSAMDIEKRVEGGIHNRIIFRNFRGGEYKVRDAVPLLDRKSAVVGNQGKRRYSREMLQAPGFDVSSGFGMKESRVNKDSHKDLGIGMHSRARDGEVGLGATFGSRTLQSGAKVERLNSQKGPKKNGLTSNSLSEGILKKYKAESAGDAPLHSGVVCVFEQPGIETPNDEDDFIQVRSKRQMLREQREQREKENKAKSKEFKAKEQTARKQQRLSTKAGQHNEAAGTISSKNVMERRSGPSAVTASDEPRLVQNLSAGVGTTLSQSTNSTSAQVLPPIGALASVVSDGVLDKTSKASYSGQASSTSGAAQNESVKLAGFAHDHHCSMQESVTNTTTAWGGQGAAHKVVSLTQIQLEEAMKPIRFEGPLPQKVPTSERASMVLEPGIPVTSMIAHEKAPAPVKAPVSVPGPISSLLAGEKIQFGAVTAPTFISSSTHPLSPALLVGVGSSLETRPDISHNTTHPNSLVRHLPASSGDPIVSSTSKGKRLREGDDIHGQVVDSEAEAEAAASAVAVAAISSDDLMGNAHRSDARNAVLGGGTLTVTGSSFENMASIPGSSGVPTTRPVIMQTPVKAPVSEDSIAVALPADLSVETPSPLLQGSLSGGQASSGFMLQSLPGVPSSFPCLEMGNMLGGPIFTFGPGEDISSLSQGSRPGVSLEPGHSVVGAGGIGGWQPRHSGAADSFYGPPPGLSGPFVSPAGRIPSIQGPPHMLVYTNPFAPVGQFGQLGVSFMGTYLPSGKQPDWKHTPMTTSSSGPLNLKEGDMNGRLPSMITSQGSTGASSSVQRILPGGSSMMPAAAPLSLFDANLSAPFQISNSDVPVQPHWSKVPTPPLHNVPMPGPAVGLNLQPRHSSALPSQLGHLPHLIDLSSGFHHLPVSKPVANSSFTSVDAAAQFPDELGLGDSLASDTSFLGSDQRSASRGHVSNSSVTVATGSSGIKSQRGRRPPRNTRGGHNSAPGSNSGNLVPGISSQGPNGSRSGSSHRQTENNGQPGSLSHQSHSLAFAEQRASQQGLARDSLGPEWSGNSHRRGAPGRTTTDRGTLGGKGFALSTKLKQVYVAKVAAPSRKLGAAAADTGSSMFSDQEVARAAMGC